LDNQQKAEDVYRYFGEQPYWSESSGGPAGAATMTDESSSDSTMEP